MDRRKIALIGNSGAGKSECVRRLGGDLAVAEMDLHFSTSVIPPYEPVLAWILVGTAGQDVIAVTTHIETLRQMRKARRGGLHADLFGQILFVYIYNSDPAKRRAFLERPDAWGKARARDHIEAVLAHHEIVYAACNGLADVTLDAAFLGMEEVAALVAATRHAVIPAR